MYVFLFLMLGQGVLGAQESSPFPLEETPVSSHDITQDNRFLAEFFYMLLMLGMLIGVVLFASYLIKRMTSTRIDSLNATSNIKILERRALSQRSQIYLVEIEDKKFMIAESPTAIAALQVASIEENQYYEGANSKASL